MSTNYSAATGARSLPERAANLVQAARPNASDPRVSFTA
jgi:hypothetical protein